MVVPRTVFDITTYYDWSPVGGVRFEGGQNMKRGFIRFERCPVLHVLSDVNAVVYSDVSAR